MDLLKKIPIQYKGELHDVRLINFSVPIEEVNTTVPPGIKVRDFDGRAMISLVDVKLKKMHPVFIPSFLNFNYRHVAFRLLVDDSKYNNGDNKGIYFLRSFTDQRLIVTGGKLMTNYNLEFATVSEEGHKTVIRQSDKKVSYVIDSFPQADSNEALRKTIGAIDRAYSTLGTEVRVTEIQREKWPIQAAHCEAFENSFFHDVRFEGAFRVFETIDYEWLPSVSVSI
jgi:uncharacterized protein YqjF (DUF2071 family)